MEKIDVIRLKEKLKRCQEVSLEEVDISTIKDISELKISKRKSSNERILDFINSVGNPYIFKIGDKLVQIEFTNNNRTADECITNVIRSIYQ